ncbi:MAG: hypothetical protein WCS65_03700 [Verrucomicrobiae bacterium]
MFDHDLGVTSTLTLSLKKIDSDFFEEEEAIVVNKRAIEHLRADPVMARLIEQIGPIRHRPNRLPPFQSLVHAVIHQQLSGKAAGTIMGRFCAIFGKSDHAADG